MRFSVSRSPSPVRRTTRRTTNGYSIHNVSDESGDESSSVSDEDERNELVEPVLTFSHAGRDTSLTLSRALTRSNPERTVDAFLAAVQLRARVDPVEEYQNAERAAIKNANPPPSAHLLAQAQALQQSHEALQAKRNAEEMAMVLHSLAQLDVRRASVEEERIRRTREGVKGMWEGIEGAIRRDEEKKRQEEERKRLDVEKKRQEEEKKRLEEERKRQEEQRKKQAEEERIRKEKEEETKRKEEEARAKKAAQEAEDKAKQEKEAAAKAEEKAKQDKAKAVSAARSAMQEWENAWTERKALKGVAKALEENTELRSVAGRLRRKLRTRVGQVTNSQAELNKLADAIHEILSPSPAHPPPVYTSLLSAFSKYLLLQAETEVTAKLPTAYPLARLVWAVVARGHERLLDVFWARFIGRTGGWGVGPGMSDTEWRKTIGLELEGKNDPDDKPPTIETSSQYTDRIVGQLALYAALLQTWPLPAPLKPESISAPFRLPRMWTWLARVLNSPEMLGLSSAPQCLGVVLEVAGDRLFEVYEGQFAKLMKAVSEVVTKGVGGEGETGARVRLGLMVERWQREGKFGLDGRNIER
ncbi:Nucleoporin [Ceratobasidium theobromae]|uniref:mRNA export factor GLE1 n=1 Tax=Ceratobasidium theobromae TaxID=1582974 RepID=A0A5N5QBY1_9AGAM|nr:Nucleoporin [Ceratobasidium theobromae]